jgi:chemotaxis signal transduction protein
VLAPIAPSPETAHVPPATRRLLPRLARRDDLLVGVVAEAVPGVHDADLASAAPAPPTLPADAAALVTGQVADRAGPIAVLDAAAVLALRDRVDRRRGGPTAA